MGNFKKIRFYSECNRKPLKVLNHGAWNAFHIFNSSAWLLFGEWIRWGRDKSGWITLKVGKIMVV